MELIDAKRFVIDNLLEGLKRGEDPATLVDRLRKMGPLSNPSTTGIQFRSSWKLSRTIENSLAAARPPLALKIALKQTVGLSASHSCGPG
jgi:hypothetical protein